MQAVVGNFSFLAILIACLGLFGLASFTMQQRTKEIGVRKVLGASVAGIVLMLSKDFTRLVFVAFIVASPIAYLAMKAWLQNFAYRTEIGGGVFAWSGLLAFIIALLTVSFQSIKAALANPVEALRYE
jgi:putative ABC transport system permease protein